MRLREVVVVAGLLFWGTASTVLSKVLYQLKGPGKNGHVHHFEKPLASTAFMFAAMALVVPFAVFSSYMEQRRIAAKKAALRARLGQPLLPGPGEEDHPAGDGPAEHEPAKQLDDDNGNGAMPHGKKLLQSFACVFVPTAFDLVATTLMNVGLLFVTASVFQMLRGAEMVFSAVYAVAFLHRTLNHYHYTGLLTSAVGIVIVGAAGLQVGEAAAPVVHVTTFHVIIGMTLITAAQAIQAAQITVEDYMLDSVKMDPLLIVGCEGVWGVLLMGAIILPIAQFLPGPSNMGLREDSVDTWEMLKHSPHIRAAVYLQMAALALYNIFGMWTTDELGSVQRTVLECLRTLFVWLVDLLLYYMPNTHHNATAAMAPSAYGALAKGDVSLDIDGRLGEPWVTPASWIQLVGFIVLVVGTLIYSEGDELTAEAHARDAATKADGQLIKKHRHHIMKHTHTLASVAWTVVAIKGAARRARWKSIATRALEAEQRLMEAAQGQHDHSHGGVRVRSEGILL